MTTPDQPTPPGTDRAQAIRERAEKYLAWERGLIGLHPPLEGTAIIRELLDQLRTAQSWIDAAVKSCASRGCSQREYESSRTQRERAEQAEARITELEAALQASQEENQKLEADIDAFNKHDHDREGAAEVWRDIYREQRDRAERAESALQARASSGATTNSLREVLADTLRWFDGWCSTATCCASSGKEIAERIAEVLAAPPVATTAETDYTAIAAHVEAVQTNFSATLRQTGSNGDDAPDDYCVLSSAIVALRRAAKAEPVATTGPDAPTLEQDIASALNRHSAENGSNTPDFILAEYLLICLAAFNQASRSRERWYGQSLSIGAKTPPPDAPTRG